MSAIAVNIKKDDELVVVLLGEWMASLEFPHELENKLDEALHPYGYALYGTSVDSNGITFHFGMTDTRHTSEDEVNTDEAIIDETPKESEK